MGRRRKRRSPVPHEESPDTTSDDDLLPRDRFTRATGSVEAKRAGAEDEQSLKRKKKGTPSKEKDQVPTKKRKIYKNRESLLTQLCAKDKNIEALYHVLILMICVGLLYSLVHDSIEAGKPHIDFRYYFSGFGPLSHQGFTLCVWAVLQLIAFSVYPIFKLWVLLHNWLGLIADLVFLGLLGLYNLFGYGTVIWMILYYDMYPVTALVLNVEQLRFCMKTYSFVRENAYKVLYPWSKDDKTGPAVWYEGQMSPKVGSFRQYIYFLFCPTLLYRDHYPRNSGPVNWQKVIIYLACFIISLLIVLPFFSRFLYPKSLHWKELVHCFIIAIPPSFVVSTLASVCVMHGWMNFGAEITRFADREFYSDWWNSTIYTEFYRKWNNIPHHFIHDYLYNDVRKVIRFKPLVLFVPLFASSVIHEYVIGVTMGVFIPILTVMFAGVGVFVAFVWPPKHMRIIRQSFFISSLSVGVAAILVCSMIEQKARELCPHEEESLLDIFMPRVIECYGVYN